VRVYLLLLIALLPALSVAQCNGHSQLCAKRYNEVAYLTTHNAFNAGDDGFNLPNQTHGLTRQLEDGVRALMLDVYDEGGVATVYHGYAFLGTTTLASNLTEIKDFLDANPTEVVTLLFETYISANMMDNEMAQAGLKPMLHVQVLGQPWPTLQDMIATGKRLVFFSDHNNAQPGQDWYHYMWDFAVETDFDNNAVSDFNCDFNRGDASNDLFIVNHFVTDATLGTGQSNQAAIINQLPYFYDRVHGCQLEKEKFPNFPTVDFYELGQTMAVVDSLNGIRSSVGIESVKQDSQLIVFPNPSKGSFQIEVPNSMIEGTYKVFRSNAQLVLDSKWNGKRLNIDLSEQPDGVYYLSVSSSSENQIRRLIKL
jgi:hypothetical protein